MLKRTAGTKVIIQAGAMTLEIEVANADALGVGLDFSQRGQPVFDRWDLPLHEQRPMMGVEIKYLDYDRGNVRLGFAAPKEVIIDREEIWLRRGATSAALSPS